VTAEVVAAVVVAPEARAEAELAAVVVVTKLEADCRPLLRRRNPEAWLQSRRWKAQI
jgi:hypothetical protein